MKLNPVGSNQTEIEHSNGVTVLFSYKTPVAAWVPTRGALCTTQRYSVTTSKHISAAVRRWRTKRIDVDQAIIEHIAQCGKEE